MDLLKKIIIETLSGRVLRFLNETLKNFKKMVNETSSRLKCWLFETHKKRKTPRWGGGKAHKASQRSSSPSTLTTQEAAMSECWGEGSPRGDEGAAGGERRSTVGR